MKEIHADSEEIKHFTIYNTFMTFLNLSSVVRKIGDNKQCEDWIKFAEGMIDDLFDNPSNSDPLLVSTYIAMCTYVLYVRIWLYNFVGMV